VGECDGVAEVGDVDGDADGFDETGDADGFDETGADDGFDETGADDGFDETGDMDGTAELGDIDGDAVGEFVSAPVHTQMARLRLWHVVDVLANHPLAVDEMVPSSPEIVGLFDVQLAQLPVGGSVPVAVQPVQNRLPANPAVDRELVKVAVIRLDHELAICMPLGPTTGSDAGMA